MRHLRLTKGLTQQELAEQLSVPQSWVSNIESARRRLGVIEALDICSALGVDLSLLIHVFEELRDAGE